MEFNPLSSPHYILYGGAFDPPHEGHRLVVKRVHDTFPDSMILLVPGRQPAGAAGQHKNTSANFEQRVEMCELAFEQELGEGYLKIDRIEGELPLPNFTVQTLLELERRYPGSDWALLVGRDQLEHFSKWRQPLDILKRVSLVVVERDSPLDFGTALANLGHDLGLVAVAERSEVWRWQELGTYIFPLKGLLSPAASRVIRENPLEAKRKDWISNKVANYIESQGLYTMKEA